MAQPVGVSTQVDRPASWSKSSTRKGIRGFRERADSLLKTTFKALCRVGLDPSRITRTAAAALVLCRLGYDRTIRNDHAMS